MIHVVMIIIAVAAAVGIMFLAYSKEGLKFRKEQGANDYITGFMMALIIYFWGMDLVSLIKGTTTNVTYSYVFVIGGPILLAIWAVYSRIKIKQAMKEPPKPYKRGPRLK